MSARRTSRPTAAPDPEDRVHTVRWVKSRKCLADDPLTQWRWSEPSQALLMTLAEAEYAAARMGGIVCVDGVPIDKLGMKPPEKPKALRGPIGAATSKADRIRTHVAAERWREALQLAIRMRNLGDDQKSIERAWSALTRSDFVRQIKQDPDALLAEGIAALRRRWGAAPR